MNALAIDTSGKNLTVLIVKDDKPFIYHDLECGINHSVEIMPKIEELILKAEFDLKNADFIACVVGAGSFTGIRIGISTAKAMCFSYKLPCLSVTSFDTIAYNKKGGKNLAVIDAKHGSYYVCGYEEGKEILSPRFIDEVELKKLKKEFTLLSSEKIEGFRSKVVSVSDGLLTAIKEKKDEANSNLDLLIPLYIRKSQAEEGR